MAPNLMRIILADPALLDEFGHYLNYALAVKTELEKRKIEVLILGNRRVSDDLKARLGILPAFYIDFAEHHLQALHKLPAPDAGQHLRLRRLINKVIPLSSLRTWARNRLAFTATVQRIERDIETWLEKRLGCGRGDVILFNSIQCREALALARWLKRRPVSDRPQIVAVLHYRPTEDSSNAASQSLWRKAFAYIERQKLGSFLHFAADSKGLAEAFNQLTCLPISVLPIPHTDTAALESKKEKIILFIGVGTRTKGFQLLPGIISKTKDILAEQGWRFIVHANFLEFDIDLLQCVDQLRGYGVEIIEGPLPAEAYYALMGRASVLLQPHDPNYYRLQTSGVFAEGRSLGLVSVLPQGTVMAEEIERHGGGIVVEEWNSDAYAHALRQAVENYDRLNIDARTAGGSWRQSHAPKAFIEKLDTIIPLY